MTQATGDKSALLSASVSVAMNTTAFGLMVAHTATADLCDD
ncbi:hypothetical protein ACBZ90_17805 (plasmid) [Vibrio alginolyticus]